MLLAKPISSKLYPEIIGACVIGGDGEMGQIHDAQAGLEILHETDELLIRRGYGE